MALYARLTPMDKAIVDLLNRRGAMTLPRIECELGCERKDPEVRAAIVHLKSLGIVRRKETDGSHWASWELI